MIPSVHLTYGIWVARRESVGTLMESRGGFAREGLHRMADSCPKPSHEPWILEPAGYALTVRRCTAIGPPTQRA